MLQGLKAGESYVVVHLDRQHSICFTPGVGGADSATDSQCRAELAMWRRRKKIMSTRKPPQGSNKPSASRQPKPRAAERGLSKMTPIKAVSRRSLGERVLSQNDLRIVSAKDDLEVP